MVSNFACWLNREVLDGHYLAWMALHVAVCSVFIAVILRLDRLAVRQDLPRSLNVVLFAFLYLFLVCLWLPNFPRNELNPDESQWIAQANNLAANPRLWIHYFLPVNLTRILTIFPLIPANILAGGNIEYDGARLVAIAMWSGFTAFTVRYFQAGRR
jgi:NADH:ubiquinone oxidoreductase subunit 6 (subunit J)